MSCQFDQVCVGTGLAVGATALYALRQYFGGGVFNTKQDQSGKIFIITGSNTGIGKETAKYILDLKGTVILANRSEERTAPLLKELQQKHGKRVEFIRLDLSDLESVKQFAQEFKQKYQRLDVLLNNAGVFMIPTRQLTKQGHEMHFGTNHLGHFLLTGLLLDLIKKTPESRVINVSSLGHNSFNTIDIKFDDLKLNNEQYDGQIAYSYSKLANVMFSKELQKRFDKYGINAKAVSLNPGFVRTEVFRHSFFYNNIFTPLTTFFSKSPLQGAYTNIQCSLENYSTLEGGAYYSDCKVKKSSKNSNNAVNCEKLFNISEQLVGHKFQF